MRRCTASDLRSDKTVSNADASEPDEKAPFAKENHPTDEHLMPIYVALGAAGKDWRGNKLHQSYDYEFLAMDAWEFKSGT